MIIGRAFGAALALTLLGGGAAMAGDNMISLQQLDVVGDKVLSETHGKDINISVYNAQSDQSLQQQLTQNAINAGAVINGNINVAPNGINFNGVGNVIMNTGNQNNLGQQFSLTLVLH